MIIKVSTKVETSFSVEEVEVEDRRDEITEAPPSIITLSIPDEDIADRMRDQSVLPEREKKGRSEEPL